jgi:hypothetical protein
MEAPDSGKLINVVTLIGLVLILFIIYKIMASVGLIKTTASKKEDAAKAAAVTDLRLNDYFSPEYYQKFGTQPLTDDVAKMFAKQLRSAMSGLGTDEESIFTIFGKLPNKTAISQVAMEYKNQYGFPFYIMGDNLQDDLLNELSPSEVTTLMGIINRLKS